METINEYLEQSQELSKKEKIEKRKMIVSLMCYLVEYDGDAYELKIQPKGGGFYFVRCVKNNTEEAYLEDYFCHSMSIARAKTIVLTFAQYYDKTQKA